MIVEILNDENGTFTYTDNGTIQVSNLLFGSLSCTTTIEGSEIVVLGVGKGLGTRSGRRQKG